MPIGYDGENLKGTLLRGFNRYEFSAKKNNSRTRSMLTPQRRYGGMVNPIGPLDKLEITGIS
jgi:hypothetical protein